MSKKSECYKSQDISLERSWNVSRKIIKIRQEYGQDFFFLVCTFLLKLSAYQTILQNIEYECASQHKIGFSFSGVYIFIYCFVVVVKDLWLNEFIFFIFEVFFFIRSKKISRDLK